MFEAPFETGNAGKDTLAIFSTLEQWAVKLRKVETDIRLLQNENELLRTQVSSLAAAQTTATMLSMSEVAEDITTEEI